MRFRAKIEKIGINPVIDPPDSALAAVFKSAGRTRGPIPVEVSLNGVSFRQTLVRYKGAWRLYVNGEMLSGSCSNVGDEVDVRVRFDSQPRDVAMPPRFESALAEVAGAAEAFASVTPGRRREILRYLGSLKTDAALERNIEKVITRLVRVENG